MCQMKEGAHHAKSGVFAVRSAAGVNGCIPTGIAVYPGRHDKSPYPFPSGDLSGFEMVYELLPVSMDRIWIAPVDPVGHRIGRAV
jgi:hypothetical protein